MHLIKKNLVIFKQEFQYSKNLTIYFLQYLIRKILLIGFCENELKAWMSISPWSNDYKTG